MRVFNFSAGPASLPEPVLVRARDELLDWQGSGTSVMEISHRSPAFEAVAERAEQGLRRLLGVPPEYVVLFLQGGATAQFAAIPLNLLAEGDRADYVDTGYWSRKAFAEAQRVAAPRWAAVSADGSALKSIPDPAGWDLDPQAGYCHYTVNETIDGVEFPWIPDTGSVPLIADASSTLLSRPLDVRRFGVLYAGAQKNIGPAGLTVVIARRDLLGRARAGIPRVFDYGRQAEARSMLNTPPTFAWYLAGLVFEWLEAEGGLAAMGERNRHKAELLYRAIDELPVYSNPVDPPARSWMNVPFHLADAGLAGAFVETARAQGLVGLEGHRSVGGLRASLYNAVPVAAVEALVAFMRDFAERHG